MANNGKAGLTEAPTGKPVSKGAATQNRILEATLAVITRDGMRGVRHRAVAQEAGVALGSTTYYFKSIDDLIASAFEYWRDKSGQDRFPYADKMAVIIEGFSTDESYGKSQAINDLFVNAKAYLHDQIFRASDDRIIELAFYHEALHSERLRKVVVEYWQNEVLFLQEFHRALGSSSPEVDAEMTLAMFHQIERFSTLVQNEEETIKRIDSNLKRHFSSCFSVDLG